MTSKRHSSVQEALDWFAAVGWLDDSPARRHFKTLVEQLEALERALREQAEPVMDERFRDRLLRHALSNEEVGQLVSAIYERQNAALNALASNPASTQEDEA